MVVGIDENSVLLKLKLDSWQLSQLLYNWSTFGGKCLRRNVHIPPTDNHCSDNHPDNHLPEKSPAGTITPGMIIPKDNHTSGTITPVMLLVIAVNNILRFESCLVWLTPPLWGINSSRKEI